MRFVFNCLIFLFSMFTLAFSENRVLNEKEWIVFIKTFNDEKFSVNFPIDPTLNLLKRKNLKEGLFLTSSQDQVHFALETTVNEGEDYFSILLNELKKDSTIELLEAANASGPIFDIHYRDLATDLFCKIRVILTSANVYYLITTFLKEEMDLHDYFISSFRIDSR